VASPKAVSPSKDPSRVDPPAQRTDLGFDQTSLVKADPNKRYKFVSDTMAESGVEAHEADGWEVERYEDGGVKLLRGKTARPGEPVTLYGQVLMSISKAEGERIEREGYLGGLGQNYLDRVRDAMTTRNGGVGQTAAQMSNRYVRVTNETEPERYVSG